MGLSAADRTPFHPLNAFLMGTEAEVLPCLQIDGKHLSVKDEQDQLPDSKTLDWDLKFAQSLIHVAVKEWQIQTVSHHLTEVLQMSLLHKLSKDKTKLEACVQIITFDKGGVTGHKNHMSCWQAVR